MTLQHQDRPGNVREHRDVIERVVATADCSRVLRVDLRELAVDAPFPG